MKRKLWLPHLSLQLPSIFCHRRRRRRKKTKNGKVKIGSSLYTLLMICCAVLYLTVTRFSWRRLRINLLQHHQSLSLTVVGYSRGAAAAVTMNFLSTFQKQNKKVIRNSIGAKLRRRRSNRQQHNPPKNESRPHPSSSFCHFNFCSTIIRKTTARPPPRIHNCVKHLLNFQNHYTDFLWPGVVLNLFFPIILKWFLRQLRVRSVGNFTLNHSRPPVETRTN